MKKKSLLLLINIAVLHCCDEYKKLFAYYKLVCCVLIPHVSLCVSGSLEGFRGPSESEADKERAWAGCCTDPVRYTSLNALCNSNQTNVTIMWKHSLEKFYSLLSFSLFFSLCLSLNFSVVWFIGMTNTLICNAIASELQTRKKCKIKYNRNYENQTRTTLQNEINNCFWLKRHWIFKYLY